MNKNDNNTQTDIDPKSQKLVSTITSFFTYFSIVIILFLILSYVGNQYIPGIGLMFLPMFLPDNNPKLNLNNSPNINTSSSFNNFIKKCQFWKYFHKKPYLASLFHKPINDNDIKDSKFIIKEENTGLKKYRLLEMGPSFYQAIGGIFGKPLREKPTINQVEIVLQDYSDDLNPLQKYLLIIFGSLQMFIGSLMTLFSSIAYLFSGKHGMFFNMPFEKEMNEKKNESNKMFKELNKASILQTESDKIVIKSGWSKFAAAFGFAYFIPVDKLTYGTQFYITERSSFINRFQYFFFILLIMIFIGTLPSSFQGGSSGIGFGIIFGIIMYLLFAKRIYNEDYQADPFPSVSSLLDKYKKYYEGSYENKERPELDGTTVYNTKKKKLDYNDLSDAVEKVKEKLERAITEYSKAYIKIEPTIKPKNNENNSGNNSGNKLSNEQVSFLSKLLGNSEKINIDNITNTRKKVLRLLKQYHPNKSKNEKAEEITRRLLEIKNKLNKKGSKSNETFQIT